MYDISAKSDILFLEPFINYITSFGGERSMTAHVSSYGEMGDKGREN